jgi:hypothetical protein
MRHSTRRRACFLGRASHLPRSTSLPNPRFFLRKRCRCLPQPDSTPRQLFTPASLPHVPHQTDTVHNRHPAPWSSSQPKHPPGQTSLLATARTPRRPSQLAPGGIQSPYIHRANGLLQIAVSTLLRAGNLNFAEALHAEHCRYGTRDLASTESFRLRIPLGKLYAGA